MSADGRYLAYVQWGETLERAAVILQSRDSGRERVVSEGDGLDQSPVFSPDGTRIARWRLAGEARMQLRVALVSGGPAAVVATVKALPEYFTRGRAIAWTLDGAPLLAPHRPVQRENRFARVVRADAVRLDPLLATTGSDLIPGRAGRLPCTAGLRGRAG